MLTSSASQYLHPEYLQPLPTTLDAKKSPLALLAQTCSSIGKDTTPSKPLIPPLEKKEGGSKSSSPSHKDDRKSQPSSDKGDRSPSDSSKGFRAIPPKDIPPLVPISSSGEKSPSSSSADGSSRPDKTKESTSVTSAITQSVTTPAPVVGAQSNSRVSLSCGNLHLEVNHQESASSTAVTSKPIVSIPNTQPSLGTALKHEGLYTPSTGAYPPPSLGNYPGCTLPLLGHPVPVDPAINPAYHASLSAHSMGLSHKVPSAGSVSPYVAYARVKTASGATTLVPVCRDPYCTNCQITLQNAQFSAGCGAGCTQCNHDKSLTVPTSLAPSGLGSSLGLGGAVPVLPLNGTSNPTSSLPLSSSLYPHSMSYLPGHHGLPYVCNWMAGSEYCGKRFTTSEELLQHLRTHTNASDSVLIGSMASHGLPISAPSALCHSHYSTPGSLSPNALRRAYPTSLSPNSVLASRFHPYKSPLSSLPPQVPTLPVPSALAPYYSPYALYGARLGAVAP